MHENHYAVATNGEQRPLEDNFIELYNLIVCLVGGFSKGGGS